MFNDSLIICKPDGTVEIKGTNENGQHAAREWTGMVSLKTGYYHILGLRTDGTVLVTEPKGQDYGQYDVEHWTNIIDIATGPLMSLGVTTDGEVLAAGDGNSDVIDLNNLSQWSDIRQIACSHGRFEGIAGLKNDGTVVFEGEFDADIRGWENVVNMYFSYGTLIGLEEDGTVHAVALTDDPDVVRWTEEYNAMPKMRHIYTNSEGVTMEGTVLSPYMSEEAAAWSDMVAMTYWNGGEWGITEDSQILRVIPNEGNSSLEEFQNLQWIKVVTDDNDSFKGILARSKANRLHSYGMGLWTQLLGELQEGTEIAAVEERFLVTTDGALYGPGGYMDVIPNTGVKEVISSSEGCILLMQDGTVDALEMYTDRHQCEGLVESWTDMVQVCGDDEWACGLKSDGRVFFVGREEAIAADIEGIYYARHMCLGLRKDGTLTLLIQSNQAENYGLHQAEQWTDIEDVALTDTHIVGLKTDGTVVAVGNNASGECDVEEWKDVISVEAANGCTFGLTKDGELLIAGAFE